MRSPITFDKFRQAALKYNLGDPEELSNTEDTALLRMVVTSHLNERCGLPPEKSVVYQHIYSKEGDLVLEMATNYRMRIPEERLDDVLRVIREVFSLPDDAQPKWYLESGIFRKDPDQYRLPSETSTTTTT